MSDAPAPVAPAPASTPAPAASEAPAAPAAAASDTPSAETANEFSGLGGDYDDLPTLEVELPAPGTEAAPAATEAAPAAKPGEAPAAPAEPPKAAEAAAPPPPAAPAGPQEPPAAPAAPSSPAEPKDVVQQLAEHRDAVLNELVKTKFGLTKEEESRLIQGLDTDATKTILEEMPKLASRVYYEAVTATLQHINNFVPRMIVNTVKAINDHEKAKGEFFKSFPTLSEEKHWSDVMQFSQLARAQNPQIKAEDLRAIVGAAIMAKHGLTAAAAAPQPPKQQTPAFVPARPGVSTVVTPDTPGPFDGLGQDFDG